MAPKKDLEAAPATAPLTAPQATHAEPAAPVATAAAPRKGLSGLGIAGIAVGSVIVAGALFGGGVLVGTHIPDGGQSAQGPNFPGGGPNFGGNHPDLQGGDRPNFPGGGPGPVNPGQDDTNSGTDSN